MLRKDVKIGLGIGGGLLAVLIVYLLITWAPPQPEVTLAPDQDSRVSGAATGTTGTGAARDASDSRTAGNPNQPDPFGNTPERSPGGAETASSTNPPTTAPADPWHAALNSGKLEGPPKLWVSETPSGDAPAPSPQPATPSDTAATGAPASTGAPDAALGNPPGPINSLNPDPANTGALSPSTRPAGQRTHVIQRNESFSTIAQAVYGSSAYYPHLMRANPNIDPKKLRPGMTIIIPDPSEVVARTSNTTTGATPASATVAPPGASSRSAPAIDPSREYRVQMNDSLYKISLKLYGRADKLDAIYQLNKDAIGPNRSHLQVGMILKLPEPPTQSAASAR